MVHDIDLLLCIPLHFVPYFDGSAQIQCNIAHVFSANSAVFEPERDLNNSDDCMVLH